MTEDKATTKRARAPAKRAAPARMATYDYRTEELPPRERELLATALAIEAEDARAAGSLGFMTRSLAIATLPHRRLEDYRYVRKNGDYTLTMITTHDKGLPFGALPRVLLNWVCTEAVQTKEPVLDLGPNLAAYLGELGLHNTGGQRGDITRLKLQMETLFSTMISFRYDGTDSWQLKNILLADNVQWWDPQDPKEAGMWRSRLQLSEPFFKECVEHPIPVDMRAMRALRQSPLAIDIYVWLTHRMSYLSKRTTIPWVSLSGQFGAGYATNDQGQRDFKRAFLRELKKVLTVYPEAKANPGANGLTLHPSPVHIPAAREFRPRQTSLPL